jgi:hypothetical protein
MNDQRLASELQQAFHDVGDFFFVERGDDFSFRVHPLGHLPALLAWDQRLEVACHSVRVGPCTPTQLEDVAETLGGDQAAPADLPLEQGIGSGGGAVDDRVDLC